MGNRTSGPICRNVAIVDHTIIGSDAFQPYGRTGFIIIGEGHRTAVRRGYAFQQMVSGGRGVIAEIQVVTISVFNSSNKVAEILFIRRHISLQVEYVFSSIR
ncbi:hypothetical protein D9M71_279970 [compost metagenome]